MHEMQSVALFVPLALGFWLFNLMWRSSAANDVDASGKVRGVLVFSGNR